MPFDFQQRIARVFGEAFENAVVEQNAVVYGRIHGNARASGNDVVYGDKK